MRIIGRTLIILLAAFLVIGATVALANSGLVPNLGNRFPGGRGELGEGVFSSENFPLGDFQRLGGEGEFQGEGFRLERGPGGQAEGSFGRELNLFSWIKNLAIIGVIVVGVVFIERMLPRKRRQLPPSQTLTPPDE